MRNKLYVVETDYDGLLALKTKPWVTGIEPIEPEDRMTEQVYRGNYGDWATETSGDVRLVISFFEGVEYDEAKEAIQTAVGTVISDNMLYGNKLEITIAPSRVQSLAQTDTIRYISQVGPPNKPCSVNSGIVAGAFWWDDYDSGDYSGVFDSPYNYTGMGIKVGIKDAGKIFNRTAFDTLTNVEGMENNEHATSVTGIVAANPDTYNGNYIQGITYDVSLYGYVTEASGSGVQDFIDGLNTYSIRIFNNSWGTDYGWEYDTPTWSDTGPEFFGKYSTRTEDWDEVMYDYFDDYLCLIKAAGNERNEGPLDDSTKYDGVAMDDGETYHCIPERSNAKNIITVGAVEWNDTSAGGDTGVVDPGEITLYMWTYPDFIVGSSTGPTDDARIKPDLVALGTDVWTTDDHADSYIPFEGTSAAAPAVTGVVALVHEAYFDSYSEYPTADIVKAVLYQTADDLGRTGPDYLYGWGLVDAKEAVDTIRNDLGGTSTVGGYIGSGITEQFGDEVTFEIEIDSSNDTSDLKVTIAWVDPEGNPNDVKAIINNLDLEISNPDDTKTFYPWVMQCVPNDRPDSSYDTAT